MSGKAVDQWLELEHVADDSDRIDMYDIRVRWREGRENNKIRYVMMWEARARARRGTIVLYPSMTC